MLFRSHQIVNLVSTRPRVSKLEFFVALALVALAQAGKGALSNGASLRTNAFLLPPCNLDVSVEQVALLAQQNTLPEPTLDISQLSYSTAPSSALGYGQPSGGSPAILRSSPAVAPPTDDPWTTGRSGVGASSSPHPFGGLNGGAPSSVAGSGLPSGWWKRQEKVSIQFGGQQGFVLNRYMVYGITTEVRGSHFLRTFTT